MKNKLLILTFISLIIFSPTVVFGDNAETIKIEKNIVINLDKDIAKFEELLVYKDKNSFLLTILLQKIETQYYELMNLFFTNCDEEHEENIKNYLIEINNLKALLNDEFVVIDKKDIKAEENVSNMNYMEHPQVDVEYKDYLEVSVFYGTNRQKEDTDDLNEMYGNDRSKTRLGVAKISIPKTHEIGEVERPSWYEFSEDKSKHIMILSLKEKSENRFIFEINQKLKQFEEDDVLVFVHGFNVTFAEAIRQTAQMAYDLKFKGAPISYSWPSKATTGLWGYKHDEATVKWAGKYLGAFLTFLVKNVNPNKVHIIAHSMGNRLFANAISKISKHYDRKLFNEVILAAPDVSAEVFKKEVIPAITKLSDRVTLYSSSEDKALKVSKTIHLEPRAGEAGDNLIVDERIDTVDATGVDTSLLGHSYFSGTKTIIDDIALILRTRTHIDNRGLENVNQRYWKVVK